MIVFLDECIPEPLMGLLSEHQVKSARLMGWKRCKNGELLQLVEKEGFDVFMTSDKNLRYQQNLKGRKLAILVLSTNLWPIVRTHQADITAALGSM
ncbi:MAG: hypothetical protein SFY92_10810 [Verrucomicrobiae bacterium]|nr:hypothetical protein [Verrucomicrobiae bacterium]